MGFVKRPKFRLEVLKSELAPDQSIYKLSHVSLESVNKHPSFLLYIYYFVYSRASVISVRSHQYCPSSGRYTYMVTPWVDLSDPQDILDN